jgi:hypothetical protein
MISVRPLNPPQMHRAQGETLLFLSALSVTLILSFLFSCQDFLWNLLVSLKFPLNFGCGLWLRCVSGLYFSLIAGKGCILAHPALFPQ